MSSTVHPDVMDSALAVLSANSQTIVALAAAPASFSDAAAANRLASATMTSADFALSDTANGRSLAVSAKSATASIIGTVNTIALLDETGQRILFSAPIPPVDVASGDVVQFLSWSISLAPTV